jgi:sporulation protein YlmC with PRC-barrel domain
MGKKAALSISRELRRKPLLKHGTSEELGRVVDVIIHPFKGMALGLLVRTDDGVERFIGMEDCAIEAGRVVASEAKFQELADFYRAMPFAVCACRELIRAYVVTNEGELLGRVSEVCLTPDQSPRVIYRLVRSPLHRLLGRGFFMAGDAPHAYSRIGARLIVPAGVSTSRAVAPLVRAA